MLLVLDFSSSSSVTNLRPPTVRRVIFQVIFNRETVGPILKETYMVNIGDRVTCAIQEELLLNINTFLKFTFIM